MKRINIFLLFIIAVLLPIYSSGRIEISEGYTDLGIMKIVIGKKYYEIFLPYEKPYGVIKVPTKDQTSLVIHKLIVDGKVVHPERKYFSTNEAVGRLYEEDVSIEKEQRKLKFLWWVLGTKPDESKIKEGLFYETVIGKTLTPEQYLLPYGSREICLKYSIQYPPGVRNDTNINLDEQYVVKWTIEWP